MRSGASSCAPPCPYCATPTPRTGRPARSSGTGSSAKYRLAITIRNDGPTAASGFSITFTFDSAYGGVTQGDNVTGWTKTLSANSIAYTRPASFPLAAGQTLAFTTDANTGSFSILNIDATLAATGWSGQTLDDTRIS